MSARDKRLSKHTGGAWSACGNMRFARAAVALAAAGALQVHAFMRVDLSMFPDGRTLTESNFTLTEHGAWLVEFFSPRCPHCYAFAPEWRAVEEKKDGLWKDHANAPFTMARVNCDVSMDLCSREQVMHFPWMTLYMDGKAVERRVDGIEDRTKLEKFVDSSAARYQKEHSVAQATAVATSADTVASSSAQTTPAAVAPDNFPVLTSSDPVHSYGDGNLTSPEALRRYLNEDHGQGPVLVKCT